MWRKVIVIGLVVGLGWTASTKDAKHNILQWNEIQKIVASHNARPLRPVAQRPQFNPNWPPSTDQIAFWDFEDGAQGWTATDGNADGFTWTVGTTYDLGSYEPPSFGSQYAYYSDDDAGYGAPNSIEWWTSPSTDITGQTSLYLNFSWGYRTYNYDDTLGVLARSKSGGTWGPYYYFWVYTGTNGNGIESGIDLSFLLPADSIQIAFKYWDYGGWNWAVGVDNVELSSGATPQPDEATDSIITPGQTIPANTPFDITIYYSNQGNVDNSYTAYLDIYDQNDNLVGTASGPMSDPVGGWTAVTFTFGSGLPKGFYWFVAYHDLTGDVNTSNDTAYWHALVLNNPGNQVLIMDLDPALYDPTQTGGGLDGQSGVWTAWAMDDLGYTVDWQWMTIPDPTPYDVAWINHGVYGYLVTLPSAFVTIMQNYLYNGGKAYAEGGDIWGWSYIWENTSTDQAKWDSLFGIDRATTSDGSSDLTTMNGLSNTVVPWVAGHTWENLGENSYMDRLAPLPDPYIEPIWENPDGPYYTGIGQKYPLGPGLRYFTIATDFELAFMNRTALDVWDYSLLEKILKQGLHENPTAVAENEPSYPLPTLKVNGTKLVFTLPKALNISLKLYDKTGRLVKNLASGKYSSGMHTISLADVNIPAGIYIARLVTEFKTYSTPVMVLNHTR